jgi:5-methylcytosine-specific restriction endonuclease McrA
MIHLVRLSIPDILNRKKVQWTDKLLEKRLTQPNARPDHNKYGHDEIKNKLFAISSYKCYYSEEKLKGEYREIDHHIEIDEKPENAYEWENLYLASANCNDKLPNKDININDVLDPFRNTNLEIETNLYFEDECILSDSENRKKYY